MCDWIFTPGQAAGIQSKIFYIYFDNYRIIHLFHSPSGQLCFMVAGALNNRQNEETSAINDYNKTH